MSRLRPSLPFLKRREARPVAIVDPPASDQSGAAEAAPEDLGPPPVLRPAAIFRQVLWDPNESTPVWARRPSLAPPAVSTPAVDPMATSAAPLAATKAPRRPRRTPPGAASGPTTSSTAPRPRRAPTRPSKPKADRTDR